MNLDNWLPPAPCKECGKNGPYTFTRTTCDTCYNNQKAKLLETKCDNCHQVKAVNQDFICRDCTAGGYYVRNKPHRRKIKI